ncbi:carbohydrate esterase family 16 protein [Ramaria rubella]|nr:carbohydrate esterase family 16 protein [Ramaria rubella]
MLSRLLALGAVFACPVSALTWGTTKFFFVFGDSYTTTGFNISAGIDSPVPGFTASNGPNWVQFLGGTYNVTDTRVFDLASGGATTDSKLVTPFEPTVLSLVDQVAQFDQFLSPSPAEAPWKSNNSLAGIFIGINDVGNSWDWTNVTQHGFHITLLNRYFQQVENLYEKGIRSFLFVNVPPLDRTPLFLVQGTSATQAVKASVADYNAQLSGQVKAFQSRHKDLDQITVFDSNALFNTLLDGATTLGFVNSTGFCEAYQNGTPETTTQVAGCAPVSSYFWLNTLHPLFVIHDILAHAISTILSR